MRYVLIIAVLAGVLGCDSAPGPDAISSHTFGLGTGGCGCHAATVGPRRQIMGTGGDFASNPSVTSRHVAGTGDPTPTQCLVCHDVSQHGQGTVRLRHADTGAAILYSAASPSSLEPFCTSCHDANGANGNMSPFADGATLGAAPYAGGTAIASSWSGASAHRSNGVTCAGTGQPMTGCHGTISTSTGTSMINMHGSTLRGMLTNTLNFQIPLVNQFTYTSDPLGSSWDYANYKLCFDCHASYPNVTAQVVLGYRSGGVYDLLTAPSPTLYSTPATTIRSLFRDHYIGFDLTRPYSDTIGGDAYLALHNFHLLGFEANALAPPVDRDKNMLQWKYRGDPAQVGRITCTACHNVHGTAVPTIRSTHQELDLVEDYYFIAFGSLSLPGERYASLNPLIDATMMTSYPMNCAITCHQAPSGIFTQSYWHTPSGD